MQHLMNCHPLLFEKELGLEELPGFFLYTKNSPRDRELPWGNTVRETSKKINNYSWNRRDNGTPGAKSEKFRKHYLSGPSQNPMQDNILIYTANFEINMSLKNATPGRILIETEKLMLRHLAERHVEYVKKQDLSKENPLKSELSAEEVLVVCETCMERADHSASKDKCVNRKKYAALTYSFMNGLIDDQLLNLHHGILIGVNTGWYNFSPPGQYSFLNVGSRFWNPGFITGYKGDRGIIFRSNGFHQELPKDNDYFEHVRRIVARLDEDYSKPIVLEYFTMRNFMKESTDEMLETLVESYFENLNKLRNEYPKLYVVVGPAVTLDLRNFEEKEYTASALKAVKLNNILSIWAVRYNVPFISSQGFINPLPYTIKGQIWWTKSSRNENEPLYNLYGETCREYLKRMGFLFDTIAECYQLTMKTIKDSIEQEIRAAARAKLERLAPLTYGKINKRRADQEMTTTTAKIQVIGTDTHKDLPGAENEDEPQEAVPVDIEVEEGEIVDPGGVEVVLETNQATAQVVEPDETRVGETSSPRSPTAEQQDEAMDQDDPKKDETTSNITKEQVSLTFYLKKSKF